MKTSGHMHTRGFTMIEILVVLGIIAVLSAVVFASFGNARAQSRDKQRLIDLAQIQLALRLYLEDNGHYPRESDGFSGGVTGMICQTCTGPINNVIRQYIGSLPVDPRDNGSVYRYYYDGDQACGGGTDKILLFARTMEVASNVYNETDLASDNICSSLGGEGNSQVSNGGASAHIIVIGESAG